MRETLANPFILTDLLTASGLLEWTVSRPSLKVLSRFFAILEKG
jgi:hypothetical protein